MGIDLLDVFRDPPAYLLPLALVAAIGVVIALVRLALRGRRGSERVRVRLGDW